MLLLVRMITRVPGTDEGTVENEGGGVTAEEAKEGEENEKKALELRRNDEMRETLCNYVLEDFPSRYAFPFQLSWFKQSRVTGYGWVLYG